MVIPIEQVPNLLQLDLLRPRVTGEKETLYNK